MISVRSFASELGRGVVTRIAFAKSTGRRGWTVAGSLQDAHNVLRILPIDAMKKHRIKQGLTVGCRLSASHSTAIVGAPLIIIKSGQDCCSLLVR
jgi:hypothetical protein